MVRAGIISIVVAFSGLTPQALCAQDLLAQERWPDGTLRATRYKEGTRVHFITYYENGQVKEMGCFNNGRRDGIWKQYNDTGVLLAQAGFRNGERQGVWEFRGADGRAVGRLVHVSGSLSKAEAFNDRGELTASRSY